MAGGKQGNKPAGASGPQQRLKIIIRRLPPDLPEQVFWNSVAPWVTRENDDGPAQEGAEKVVWSQFCPGILRSASVGKDKVTIHARAYITFRTPDSLVAFHKAYDGWTFRDKQGNLTPAVVEFAPYQRIPTAPSKPDPRQGSIDTDADFLSFQESLNAPEPAQKPEENTGPSDPTSTPLLEHLRSQKAAAEAASRKRSTPNPSTSSQKQPKPAGKPDSSASSKASSKGSKGNREKGGRGKGKEKGKEGRATPSQGVAEPGAAGPGFPSLGSTSAPSSSSSSAALQPQHSNTSNQPRHQHPPRGSQPSSRQPQPTRILAPPPTQQSQPQISLLTRPSQPSPAGSGTTTPTTSNTTQQRRPPNPTPQAGGNQSQQRQQQAAPGFVGVTANQRGRGGAARGGGISRGGGAAASQPGSLPAGESPAVSRGRGRGRGRGGPGRGGAPPGNT